MNEGVGEMREAIGKALLGFADAPLREGAAAVLNALGYASERTADAGNVAEFLDRYEAGSRLTEKQRALFESWREVELVFQVTDEEVAGPGDLSTEDGFDACRIRSFVFIAVELASGPYSRTRLAEMTRALNRLFEMPAMLLLRCEARFSLAVIHRRPHRRDDSRDVLEKVTLVKDVEVGAPHRAHLDILADLALPRMVDECNVASFEDLHRAWEDALDTEELNRRFYRELFEWFERAVAACRFPDDGAGDGSTERHVIRLITRLLFVWFLKEKGLIPEALFEEGFARRALERYAPEGTDYYRAVLQNLFFATLNTGIDKRAFSEKGHATHRDFTKYRYRDLLADPDGFVEILKKVPFVNGGLFDCLDDFASVREGGRRIDAFTDNIAAQGKDLSVPALLFLGEADGLFPLFRRYKFTVEENTPLDREVALDPELLGRAFENLLAAYNPETRETARKATGSYYTPRTVVDYMVREALAEALAEKSGPADGDTAFWRERLLYLLDHSDAMDDADELFGEDEKRGAVAGIADLRTLDPAVGSGAFPMGVLQTLTLALRRLDPDNALWEELQKERAKAQAGAAFDTGDREAREAELREINDTFERYRQSDFGRKLYLIQNGIYGVDLQPIACQIAKLRFFISLAIEQEADPEAPNLGIKPLPNLETRFVAADTLIGLGRQGVLRSDAVKALENKLRRVRESYFNAGARDAKRRLRADDEDLRDQLARELEGPDFGRDDAKAIARWDPYDQNARADWFDPEWMFGVADGFDIVLGNPPYIQLQKDGGRAGTKYRDAGYETFVRTGDVYQIFYERGCGLLKPRAGVLAYITSNSWLKAEYGRPLRRWLARGHTPLRLVEMGKDVFDAIVDASVLLVREGGGAKARVPAVDLDRLGGDGGFPPSERVWGEARPDGTAPWSILSAVEWRVLDKMRTAGTPLRDWNVRINYGIKTGYNEAFVIDDTTRDALVAKDPRSEEILKPMLRGRDIRRWRARWAGKYLVATLPSLQLDIDDYPAVKKHLLSFGRDRLEQSGQSLSGGIKARKKTYNAWFETQDAVAYHKDFTEEKLLWMDMSPEARFAYSEYPVFCNDKGFILTGRSLKYLCAILNSSLITWLVTSTALTTGVGLSQWKKFTIERIPIPESPREARSRSSLVRLVDDILAAKDADPGADVTEQEKEIDHLVYTLYGLSEAEIAAVEKGRP